MKTKRIILKLLSVLLLCSLFLTLKARKKAGAAAKNNGLPHCLNLMPDIKRGLDFIVSAKPRESARANTGCEIDLWNGKEAVSIELEDYIVHVVAGEMPASYEEEALKAQAVAARTFTVKHIVGEARCKSGHTVCTSPACCQAFKSTEELKRIWGDSFKEYYTKIQNAVKATEGMIITCDGEIINAFYHSSSGGKTESAEAVFAVTLPYLVSVDSLGEENYADFASKKEFSIAEFIKKVNKTFPEAELKNPRKEVSIWGRTESGRVQLIRLGNTVITGAQMRKLFKLHSTNFSVEITEKKVIMTCKGFGHGVGMSQCGANEMAKDGASFEEILKHYYTGVEIGKFPQTGSGI